MMSLSLPYLHLHGPGPHGLTVSAPPANHPTVTLRIPLEDNPATIDFYGTPEQLLALAAEIASVVADHLDRPPVTVDDVTEALRAGGREWSLVETEAEGGEER